MFFLVSLNIVLNIKMKKVQGKIVFIILFLTKHVNVFSYYKLVNNSNFKTTLLLVFMIKVIVWFKNPYSAYCCYSPTWCHCSVALFMLTPEYEITDVFLLYAQMPQSLLNKVSFSTVYNLLHYNNGIIWRTAIAFWSLFHQHYSAS